MCVCVCGCYLPVLDTHAISDSILTVLIYWKCVNLLNICGRQTLLNWASLWCRTCKNWGQLQPSFRGGVCDSDGTLGRQHYLCNHTPIEFSLLSQAIHRDLSNSKKEREIWKEQERAKKRERGEREERRGEEMRSASAAPSAWFQAWLWKKCCWWRVQMLKEGMIANKYGQKTRVSHCSAAALLLCAFTMTF